MLLKFKYIAVTGFFSLAIAACSSSSATKASEMAKSTPTQTSEISQMPGHGGMGGGMGMSMDMNLGPADANYDLRFIDAMIPHHQGAVEMAKEALQKSQRPEIKKLATDIIQAQDQEITQMKQWRQTWYPQASDTPMAWSSEMGHMMAMDPDQRQGMMMSQGLGSANTEFDLRFINAMIPHHQGAITIAKDALGKSKHAEIKQLAQAIIASQQAEIKQMEQWQQAWYKL